MVESISETISKSAVIIEETNKFSPMVVSIFCIVIILVVLFTQCEVSNIKLKPKDASLVLIFLALLSYVNGYEKLFVFLLILFIIIYFVPQEYIQKYIPSFKQEKPKKIPRRKREIPEEDTMETVETVETNEINDNEITIDTDIESEIETKGE